MKITASQRFWWSVTGWRGFVYPNQPTLPPRPWHSDGDDLWVRPCARRLENSDGIIAHMKRYGTLSLSTGSTKPATWDGSGTVNGYVLNRAQASDRVFVIERPAEWASPRQGTIYGTAYGSDPLGARVRYDDRMIRQGEPAGSYSDNKVHIYDDVEGGPATITEIQNFRGVVNGVIQCDGVSQYRLDTVSWDVRGRSAARVPLAESVLRYDDVRRGDVRRTTMGTKMASSKVVLWPAKSTDSGRINANVTGHLDADAVPMGAVLRLKASAVERIRRVSGLPVERRHMLDTVLACLSGPGVMVVDTGGGHGFALEPDNRWDQREVGVLKQLTLDDFEVWCLEP
jgi:hypothetical protein